FRAGGVRFDPLRCCRLRSRSWHSLGGALRPARDPARLEFGEQLPLPAMVDDNPRDQRGENQEGGGIGADDEGCVLSKVHRARTVSAWVCRAAASACISISVRTRRRMISLRMAARGRVKNRRKNASARVSSGIRSEGWMVGPPSRNTDAG